MKWFKNLKVGPKLVFGFTVMILIAACLGFVGYRSATVINHGLQDIFSLRLPSIDYLIEADRDLQQALVAERSMIFANTESDVFKGLVKEYEENLEQSDARWNKYKALASTPEEAAIIPQYEEARTVWEEVSRRVVDGRSEDTRQGRRLALDLTLGEAQEKFEVMRDFLDQLTGINLAIAENSEQEAADVYHGTLVQLLGIVGASLLLGMLLMWAIGRGVTRPLRNVIQGLNEASDQVASGSSQVATSSQLLAEGSSEQAASIEETSSSLEEMSSMTKQNAENANQANGMMQKASEIVEKVNRHMGEMAGAIDEITRSSEETGKIIKTIDEIAFQTNLLALNAAVEAARAGEAGAGFAVVADEVRNLAMRAAEAAKNTAQLIEDTIKAVQNGNELTKLTQGAFNENMEIAGKVGELVDEIAAASNEQAQGIDQVNTAVAEMDKVVQQVAANAEESASTSEEMSAQADQMKHFVDDLKSLVGGENGARGKRARTRRGKDSKGDLLPVQGMNRGQKKQAGTKAIEVVPEQVIPMEDRDFQDF
ncbi:MAG: methyl-accepting chemotaxis protein [Desulfobacteraceae bacterium]